MRNTNHPPNHTRFIIACITFLSALAMCLGYHLLLKGYQSGELLVTSGGVAGISGLVGFLGGKMSGDRPAVNAQGDVNLNTPQTPNATQNP